MALPALVPLQRRLLGVSQARPQLACSLAQLLLLVLLRLVHWQRLHVQLPLLTPLLLLAASGGRSTLASRLRQRCCCCKADTLSPLMMLQPTALRDSSPSWLQSRLRLLPSLYVLCCPSCSAGAVATCSQSPMLPLHVAALLIASPAWRQGSAPRVLLPIVMQPALVLSCEPCQLSLLACNVLLQSTASHNHGYSVAGCWCDCLPRSSAMSHNRPICQLARQQVAVALCLCCGPASRWNLPHPGRGGCSLCGARPPTCRPCNQPGCRSDRGQRNMGASSRLVCKFQGRYTCPCRRSHAGWGALATLLALVRALLLHAVYVLPAPCCGYGCVVLRCKVCQAPV